MKRAYSTAIGKKVGFLGLGNMGLPMAVNLQKNGFDVTGFEIGEKQKENAKQAGTKVASSIAEAVKNADWVVTALPKTEHVQQALIQPGGIFESAKKGAYIIDVSTISPIASAQFNKDAAARGLVFLDSPMSGGTNGAIAGTLSFMVGGEKEQFEHAKNLLKGMGANFFHCGKPGSGEVAKLVNNLMLAINMISTAEGFAMGTKLGMDPKVLNDILSVSTGRSFVVTNYNPHPGIQANAPASRDYEGGFGTMLMHKDLVLAIDAAKEAGIPVDFTKNAKAYFEDVGNQGKGHKDFSYVYEYIKGNKKV